MIRRFLINFADNRAVGAVFVFIKRSAIYGSGFSWQCRWTLWQERFWNKLSDLLFKGEK